MPHTRHQLDTSKNRTIWCDGVLERVWTPRGRCFPVLTG